jgi:hypothetical protein
MQFRDVFGQVLRLYDLPVQDLLTGDPPAATLAGLAERTGISVTQQRAMTPAGWVPG